MQLGLEVFDCFPKNNLHLCVVGSNPIRSNAITQSGRVIEVNAGSNPAPINFGWTSGKSCGSQKPAERDHHSLKDDQEKTDLSLSVKLRFLNLKFHTHDKASAKSNVF